MINGFFWINELTLYCPSKGNLLHIKSMEYQKITLTTNINKEKPSYKSSIWEIYDEHHANSDHEVSAAACAWDKRCNASFSLHPGHSIPHSENKNAYSDHRGRSGSTTIMWTKFVVHWSVKCGNWTECFWIGSELTTSYERPCRRVNLKIWRGMCWNVLFFWTLSCFLCFWG